MKDQKYDIYYRPYDDDDETGYVGSVITSGGFNGAFGRALRFFGLDPEIFENEGAIIPVNDEEDNGSQES